jgi:hypothetical protein
MAEKLLAEDQCDVIGAARQSLADPDWFRKISLGLGHTMRVCEFTNYCEGLDQKHKPVTCKLWDKLPSADGERRTPDGKRRLTAPAWTRRRPGMMPCMRGCLVRRAYGIHGEPVGVHFSGSLSHVHMAPCCAPAQECPMDAIDALVRPYPGHPWPLHPPASQIVA